MNNKECYVLLSVAEILDKYSILSIKKENIKDSKKLCNIDKELQYLSSFVDSFLSDIAILNLYNELKQTNQRLWLIEDAIRQKEKNQTFDNEFIELARSVYLTNDQRSVIKKNINIKSNSVFIEEKSYS